MVFAKIIIGDSRKMIELKDSSIDLVVTSPPYWHIKNYGVEGQIGYGQSLHEYLKSLYIVWKECFRVLKPGTRLCINIGDQFLRGIVIVIYVVLFLKLIDFQWFLGAFLRGTGIILIPVLVSF